MIELYSWGTSNGRKVSILLEELEMPYTPHPIDISKGDQFTPEYTALNPNQKIPTIVDTDGPGGRPITIFESGAILIYLAEKAGRFLPTDPHQRFEVLQWLMFQMGGVGPIFGQVHHFRRAASEQVPYAIERFDKEARRVYGVLDGQLRQREFIASSGYSIADMAIFPWTVRHEWQQVDLADYPGVKRWFDALSARPAVQRGLQVLVPQ